MQGASYKLFNGDARRPDPSMPHPLLPKKMFVRNGDFAQRNPLRLQSRDKDVLQQLINNRFLTTSQLEALNPNVSKKKNEHTDQRHFRRRLQLLFQHGYIDRPPAQLLNFVETGEIVHAIGDTGADILFGDDPAKRAKINWAKKNGDIKPWSLNHPLMVARFRTILTVALRDHPTAILANWLQGEELKNYVRVKNKDYPLIPDGFPTINTSPQYASNYFLEADRSTESGELIKLEKVWRYDRWHRSDAHQKRYNIPSFQVLIVTISEERAKNLREKILKDVGRVKVKDMFWFTCEKNYSLEKPETILEPIWHSTGDDELHHLLE